MKRVISLLLVLVMCIGLMACASGCKKNNPADTSLLNGVNIRIASWGSAKPTEGTEDGDLRYAAIDAACKKYGCTVEWFTFTDMTQRLLTAATTGSVVAEVVMQRAHRVLELLEKGDYFWSLDELDGKPKKDIYNTDTTKYTTLNGKTYGFWYDPTNVNVMLAINKSLISKAGADLPYNLVEDRKWTFDAWSELLSQTCDPENKIYGSSVYNSFGIAMLHANKTSLYTEKNGVHLFNNEDPKVTEIIESIREAVLNDKTVTNNIGAGTTELLTDFINGKFVTLSVGRANCRDDLAKKMNRYWANFVKNGDPNGEGLTKWTPITEDCKGTMMLDSSPWMGERKLNRLNMLKMEYLLNKK